MFIIQNGLEKKQTFQMKRYTSLLLSQYYEIFISIKERTEEELDKETKKKKTRHWTWSWPSVLWGVYQIHTRSCNRGANSEIYKNKMTRVSSETVADAVNKVQVELLHNSSNFGLGPSGLDNSCRSFSCRRELLVPQLEKFMGPVVISLIRFFLTRTLYSICIIIIRRANDKVHPKLLITPNVSLGAVLEI